MTYGRKYDFENFSKEEADHFDVQSPITIQVADKEKIGKIKTGHHKMKVSAIYNIKSFKFSDWETQTKIQEWFTFRIKKPESSHLIPW